MGCGPQRAGRKSRVQSEFRRHFFGAFNSGTTNIFESQYINITSKAAASSTTISSATSGATQSTTSTSTPTASASNTAAPTSKGLSKGAQAGIGVGVAIVWSYPDLGASILPLQAEAGSRRSSATSRAFRISSRYGPEPASRTIPLDAEVRGSPSRATISCGNSPSPRVIGRGDISWA